MQLQPPFSLLHSRPPAVPTDVFRDERHFDAHIEMGCNFFAAEKKIKKILSAYTGRKQISKLRNKFGTFDIETAAIQKYQATRSLLGEGFCPHRMFEDNWGVSPHSSDDDFDTGYSNPIHLSSHTGSKFARQKSETRPILRRNFTHKPKLEEGDDNRDVANNAMRKMKNDRNEDIDLMKILGRLASKKLSKIGSPIACLHLAHAMEPPSLESNPRQDWLESPVLLDAIDDEDDGFGAELAYLFRTVSDASAEADKDNLLPKFLAALNFLRTLHDHLHCPLEHHKAFWNAHYLPTNGNLASILIRLATLNKARSMLMSILRMAVGQAKKKDSLLLRDRKRRVESRVASASEAVAVAGRGRGGSSPDYEEGDINVDGTGITGFLKPSQISLMSEAEFDDFGLHESDSSAFTSPIQRKPRMSYLQTNATFYSSSPTNIRASAIKTLFHATGNKQFSPSRHGAQLNMGGSISSSVQQSTQPTRTAFHIKADSGGKRNGVDVGSTSEASTASSSHHSLPPADKERTQNGSKLSPKPLAVICEDEDHGSADDGDDEDDENNEYEDNILVDCGNDDSGPDDEYSKFQQRNISRILFSPLVPPPKQHTAGGGGIPVATQAEGKRGSEQGQYTPDTLRVEEESPSLTSASFASSKLMYDKAADRTVTAGSAAAAAAAATPAAASGVTVSTSHRLLRRLNASAQPYSLGQFRSSASTESAHDNARDNNVAPCDDKSVADAAVSRVGAKAAEGKFSGNPTGGDVATGSHGRVSIQGAVRSVRHHHQGKSASIVANDLVLRALVHKWTSTLPWKVTNFLFAGVDFLNKDQPKSPSSRNDAAAEPPTSSRSAAGGLSSQQRPNSAQRSRVNEGQVAALGGSIGDSMRPFQDREHTSPVDVLSVELFADESARGDPSKKSATASMRREEGKTAAAAAARSRPNSAACSTRLGPRPSSANNARRAERTTAPSATSSINNIKSVTGKLTGGGGSGPICKRPEVPALVTSHCSYATPHAPAHPAPSYRADHRRANASRIRGGEG